MASGSRQAKFFCEHCGEEVPQSARFCRKCGRFFASVRCPACGFTGKQEQFSKGCPKCGYAVGGSHKGGSRGLANGRPAKSKGRFPFHLPEFSGGPASDRAQQQEDSLPGWVYAFTIAILFGTLLGVYMCSK